MLIILIPTIPWPLVKAAWGTEAQRGGQARPGLYSQEVAELGPDPRQPGSGVVVLTMTLQSIWTNNHAGNSTRWSIAVDCCCYYSSNIPAQPFWVLDILVLLAWMKLFFWINSTINPLEISCLRILFLLGISPPPSQSFHLLTRVMSSGGFTKPFHIHLLILPS